MIDKINNTYTNPYATGSGVKRRVEETDIPKFMLPGDEEGVVWDREDNKANKPSSKTPELNSDTVTISSQNNNGTNLAAPSANKTAGAGLLQSVKNLFKKIFDFIWYGNDAKETDSKETDSKEKSEETSRLNKGDTDKKYETAKKYETVTKENKDEVIRQLIKDKDSDGIMNVLTEGGKHMPARCTTMLTYYDRHGRIVNNSTNEGRVLRGDKNTFTM